MKLHFIGPGKPMENAYAESLIGKLRDECLTRPTDDSRRTGIASAMKTTNSELLTDDTRASNSTGRNH